jgi:hypothetical protein
VSTGDATPDATDLGAIDLTLGTVDKGNTLAEVEFSVGSSLHTLDLDERDVRALVALGTLESKNTTFGVKTKRDERCSSKSRGKKGGPRVSLLLLLSLTGFGDMRSRSPKISPFLHTLSVLLSLEGS